MRHLQIPQPIMKDSSGLIRVYCTLCRRLICGCKDTITKHLDSKKHKNFVNERIEFDEELSPKSQQELTSKIITSWIICGIPLEKIEKLMTSRFLLWSHQLRGVPKANTLRKNWVPKLLDEVNLKLIRAIPPKGQFHVLVDETSLKYRTDSITNIILKDYSRNFLIKTAFTRPNTAVSLLDLLEESMKDVGLDLSNIFSIVSDGCSVNIKMVKLLKQRARNPKPSVFL